jgi:hypothetical protein
MVRAGAGAGIFYNPELEPHKNGPAPQHWLLVQYRCKSLWLLLGHAVKTIVTVSVSDLGGVKSVKTERKKQSRKTENSS